MTQDSFHDGDDDYSEEEEDAYAPEWADQVMATVAAEVRRRRKERGMSAQELADTCAEIGYPIPRNVIANMESGRRATLPLVEVMVLAAALNTHPILLIYPVGHADYIQRLPLQDATFTWHAMDWFIGGEGPWETDTALLHSFREHQRHESAATNILFNIQHQQWKAKTASNPEQRARAEQVEADYSQRLQHTARRIRIASARIREYGGNPPSLVSDVEHLVFPETHDRTDSI